MSEPKVETKKRERTPVKSKFTPKRRINVPLMKLSPGDSIALEFTGEQKSQKIGDKSKEPATIYRAINLDTGEVCDVIMSTVALSTLEREFGPGASPLKGKKLLLEVSKREDKRYNDVLVSEL